MVLRCAKCQSTSVRLSKVRGWDIFRLFPLLYPIRCRDCHARSFVFLSVALALKKQRKKHA